MERSKYVDGVEIGSEHLNYTEVTKIEAIKRIITILGTTGIVKGLFIAPDPLIPSQIMMSAGVGWTYGGDFVFFEQDQMGIIISNSIGIQNYVSIKMTENESMNLPHVVTGEMHGTKIIHSYEVRVYTKIQWQQLLDKDKHVLVAIVTGNGGMVRGIDIRNNKSIEPALMAVERQTTAITGCNIKTISANTLTGEGKLQFLNNTLLWKDPGGMSFGLPVIIGTSGIYIIYDFIHINFIKVEVDVTKLPNENIIESVDVINLLQQHDLSLGTSKDILHRGFLGTGTSSPTNPHGMTLDDLDPGEQQDLLKHRYYSHSPGIIGSPGSATAAVSIFSSNQIRINPILPKERILSGGIIYEQLADVYIVFSGVGGTYNVYIGEGGKIKISIETPSDRYLLLCTVKFTGATLSNLIDLRVWGSVSLSGLVHNDNDDFVLDASLTNRTFSASESLAIIRGAIKNIIGKNNWKDVPSHNLIELFNLITILQNTMAGLTSTVDSVEKNQTTHEQLSLLTGTVHGVTGGIGGGINADVLRGLVPVDRPIIDQVTLVKTQTDGFLHPNWFLGSRIPMFEAMGSTPFYSNLQFVAASGGNPNSQAGFSMRVIFSDQVYYMPASTIACGCTITCGCTGTCGCTCTGTCGCTGTAGCHFWG